jgi:hypothetical protein
LGNHNCTRIKSADGATVSTVLKSESYSTFDPELIVLGGGVTRSADLLVEPILRRIEGAIPILPRLVVSTLERRAVVMGAIANVLHNTSDFFMVRKLS